MKKGKIVCLFLLALTSIIKAQPDKILGLWLTEDDKSQVQIFKTPDGKYFGKILWLKDHKYDCDTKNPDVKLRSKKILGLQLLNNFKFNTTDKEWVGGTVYDPDNGKTYDSYMWFDMNNNELHLKGYVLGMRFLGRQTLWKRENNLRN